MSKDNDFPRLLEKQDLTTSRLRIDLTAEQYKDHHPVPLSSETSSSSGTYFLSLFRVCETFSPREHIPLHISSYHPQGQRRNKSNDGEHGEGGGRRDEGSNVYKPRWEMGGREGERKRKKERVGCTKYQRTILQSKQDGGCHTAYPRLNATSYFESSSNASLSLPSPGVTPRSFSSKLERVPPDRMHRCHRYPPFFLASSPRPTREKQFRPANGGGWLPVCDHLASNFASERPVRLTRYCLI